MSFSEFVATGLLGPVNEKKQDALSKSVSSGRHVSAFINGVLDITKLEVDMMGLFIEDDVNLNQEFQAIIGVAEALMKSKTGVVFRAEIPPHLPIVSGDKRRLRQIFLNLLSNAVKFTESGEICFTVELEENSLLCRVKDTGIGIAPEEMDIIFQPFHQSEGGIMHAGGTGLGLPISKRLVESYGGSLWAESTLGKGSCFFVRLPLKVTVRPT